MVYSLELLNTQNEQPDPCTTPLQPSPYNPFTSNIVSVIYNGQRIEEIAGPTPFVDFSSSVERTESGLPMVINNKIVLTGKIVRTASNGLNVANYGSGIIPMMDGIERLQRLFKCGDCGAFSIECVPGGGGEYSLLFGPTGVRVVDFSFNKSDNNWLMTADYTITLEYLEPVETGRYIRSYSDSWNVEQLENYTNVNYNTTVIQKQEWDNPNVMPPITVTQTQNQTGANTVGTALLTNFSVPRYKVSRTVSAVGIPSGTGYCNNPQVPDPLSSSYTPYEMDAFSNAKKWVHERAKSILEPTNRPPNIPGNPNTLWSPLVSGYLYNHVRSTRFDIQAASYEITDTYLAMPTGIGYLEDYTIEISTDNKYIHTVRVNGEIQGLSIPQISNIKHSSVLITGSPAGSTDPNMVEINLALGHDYSIDGPFAPPNKVPDSIMQQSKNTQLSSSRYINAFSGWIYDIKPYVYRRACSAMQSADRTKGYINPTDFARGRPPNNPIYSQHGVLNIIPISTTEGHDRRQGKITYSHEFNNKFTIISGALYESVNISTNGPADVIAEAFVLGRQLGPILQDLGSKTSSQKSISIEVGVVPPSTVNGYFLTSRECPLWTGGSVYKTINELVEGLKPYGDREAGIFGSVGVRKDVEGRVFVSKDEHSWNPSEGVYSRNVGWVYQPCTNKQSYLDN